MTALKPKAQVRLKKQGRRWAWYVLLPSGTWSAMGVVGSRSVAEALSDCLKRHGSALRSRRYRKWVSEAVPT